MSRTNALSSHVPLLVALGALVACSSSTPATSTDAGREAATATDGSTQPPSPCDGKAASGILGTWLLPTFAGGSPPTGGNTVVVYQRYRFCGTESSGTFRYTEDAVHVAGPDCQLVEDFRGTFTFEPGKLTLRTSYGISEIKGCKDPSQNNVAVPNVPSTETRSVTLEKDQLLFKQNDGSVIEYKRDLE